MTGSDPLVRYVSPFGSPAWMPESEARRYLDEDDRRWCLWQERGLLDALLTDEQRQMGPPRIEGRMGE